MVFVIIDATIESKKNIVLLVMFNAFNIRNEYKDPVAANKNVYTLQSKEKFIGWKKINNIHKKILIRAVVFISLV